MCWHHCRNDVAGTQMGQDQTAAIDRNNHYFCRQHGAKFHPRALSDKLHDVKITFSLYKTTLTLSVRLCFEKQSRREEMETVSSSKLFHTICFHTAGK